MIIQSRDVACHAQSAHPLQDSIVLAFAAVLVFVVAASAAAMPAHAETFSNGDFGMQYPDGWHVVSGGTWESARTVTFAPETANPDASITISLLYDGYPKAGSKKTIQIEQADLDVAEQIAEDAEKRCRTNLDGPCWRFEMLDSKITAVSYQRAVQLDFGARINDVYTLTRLVVLPLDSGVWVAKGMAVDGLEQQVWDALGTFEPAGLEPDPGPGAAILHEPVRGPLDPALTLEKTLRINMIMVGQEWSSLDTARIIEELPSYHDPVFTTTGDRVGIRYHYAYNFVSDVESTDELLRVMDENSRAHPVLGRAILDFPFWHATWLEDHQNLHGKQYRLVDALAVEEYVHDAIIGTNPDLSSDISSTVNLVFFNIGPDKNDYIQNYYMPTADRATGEEVNYVGMMGFGSSSNAFFFDMWALPWVDPDLEGLYRSPAYMDNLHDCWEPSCLADIVSHHAESAIYHILTPSFLYPVEFHDNYFLDVLLYLTPGGRVTVTPSVLDHFMNRDEIIREMEYLYPFAEWDVALSIERRDLRGMSYEFKEQFGNARHERVEFFDESIRRVYHDPDEIKPYLIEWAQQRQQQQSDTPGASNDTWTIPMLIVVDNTDAEVLLEGGAIGIAPGMPDDESMPCCALAVTDASDVWESRLALDNLILHEVGHVMGLHHPFASYKYGEPTYDFYFNWYSSPMAYSFPGGWGACGLLYTVFYESPCGHADASFTVFERERLGDARLVSLLQKIDAEVLGLSGDAAAVAAVEANMTEIKRIFASGDTLSEKGALRAALVLHDAIGSGMAAAEEANAGAAPTGRAPAPEPGVTGDKAGLGDDPAEAEGVSDVPAEPDTAGLGGAAQAGDAKRTEESSGDDMHDAPQAPVHDELPAWVKNSAGWWAEGLIGDSEFISSIEYMIEQGVIVVDIKGPDPAGDDNSGSSSHHEIPAWVKNSAGWWADGLLGDDEFAGNIRYLISAGIIRV